MKESEETLDTTNKRRALRAESVAEDESTQSAENSRSDREMFEGGDDDDAMRDADESAEADAAAALSSERRAANEPPDERVREALHAASDKKALAPVILDLRDIANFTDFFIIVSGANQRQVQAISDEVVERMKRQGTRAARVEGYAGAEWTLIDYGDFIVHVFDEKSRAFYDLERLWRDARRIDPATLGVEV